MCQWISRHYIRQWSARNQRLRNRRDDPYHPHGCLSLLSVWSSRLWHSQEAQAEFGSLPNLGRWSWGLRKFKGQQLQGRVAERTASQRHRRAPRVSGQLTSVQQVRTVSTARERILPRTRGNTTGNSQKARINSCTHRNSQGIRTPGRVISWCSGETSPRLIAGQDPFNKADEKDPRWSSSFQVT